MRLHFLEGFALPSGMWMFMKKIFLSFLQKLSPSLFIDRVLRLNNHLIQLDCFTQESKVGL